MSCGSRKHKLGKIGTMTVYTMSDTSLKIKEKEQAKATTTILATGRTAD
jgi:hypothetical protein